MKKFAIGCLIVLGVCFVAGSIGLYYAYNRLIKPGMEMAASVKELGKLGDLEKQVTNTSVFDAPANGELTQEMVDRFVKVQQQMQSRLGARMAELKAKYDQLDRSLSGEKRTASIKEVATGLKDLASIILDGKAAQIEALNQSAFSVREYEWVRGQVYAAIGVVAVGMDMKKMATEVEAGNIKGFSRPERGTLGEVPERNKTLVAPYEKQLKDWAPMAFFGL